VKNLLLHHFGRTSMPDLLVDIVSALL